ncbi:ARPP-1 family domain-containing protein [Haliea sp.]
MTMINVALHNVALGETQTFANLSITPLMAANGSQADYLTLAEAQALGLAVVTEVSESGSVPTLLLDNTSEQAVFLLDGEELVGAKQNRILNLSILVPAKTKLEIPVSCVEQGRWSHLTREFASAERTFFSKGRARKAARVSENLRDGSGRNSNQSEVWSDIGDKMRNMAVGSATGAISDAYEHFSVSVDEYVAGFQVADNQIGACFAINGEIRGVELFDASATCGKLMPKLIRSYALDAIEEQQSDVVADELSVESFLEAVAAAQVDSFTALGEGEDLRVHSSSITGGALAARNRVIHLCAFSQESEEAATERSGRMRRVSGRQDARADHLRQRDAFDDGDEFDLS